MKHRLEYLDELPLGRSKTSKIKEIHESNDEDEKVKKGKRFSELRHNINRLLDSEQKEVSSIKKNQRTSSYSSKKRNSS